VSHHRRGRPKNQRTGCLLCKPHKANGVNAPTNQEARALIDELEQLLEYEEDQEPCSWCYDFGCSFCVDEHCEEHVWRPHERREDFVRCSTCRSVRERVVSVRYRIPGRI